MEFKSPSLSGELIVLVLNLNTSANGLNEDIDFKIKDKDGNVVYSLLDEWNKGVDSVDTGLANEIVFTDENVHKRGNTYFCTCTTFDL